MENQEYKPVEEKMEKTIQVLKDELGSLRAGRANPSLLNKITVDYYGVQTPITQLANISVPEAKLIVIHPWDAKILQEVEKSIQKSDIGINPINDGKVIRLVFPALTEERRKELVKIVRKNGEEAKISIRSIRRDIIDSYKKQEKNSEITEDDLKDSEKDIQEITDSYIKEIDRLMEDKEKEIMEV
jgi:ribosome recycling factor